MLVIGESETKVETREKLLRLVRKAPDISTDRIEAELSMTRKGVEWQIKQLKEVGGPDTSWSGQRRSLGGHRMIHAVSDAQAVGKGVDR